ncbi:unnamed protein product [Protopolystoma xenopodis]|uniref:Uncharacterized protein n=1 Tax=Protopolystoma xenopodis TaxID=117903 RepID=A0A448WU09_9PLAT|nr:unnamed protein product [Protopolystoma xenopodis]
MRRDDSSVGSLSTHSAVKGQFGTADWPCQYRQRQRPDSVSFAIVYNGTEKANPWPESSRRLPLLPEPGDDGDWLARASVKPQLPVDRYDQHQATLLRHCSTLAVPSLPCHSNHVSSAVSCASSTPDQLPIWLPKRSPMVSWIQTLRKPPNFTDSSPPIDACPENGCQDHALPDARDELILGPGHLMLAEAEDDDPEEVEDRLGVYEQVTNMVHASRRTQSEWLEADEAAGAETREINSTGRIKIGDSSSGGSKSAPFGDRRHRGCTEKTSNSEEAKCSRHPSEVIEVCSLVRACVSVYL